MAAIVPSQNVDESQVGDRAVLYNRESREALVLNPTGSWLWRQLKSGQTRDELAIGLRQRYNLSEEQAVRDLDQFLVDLARHAAIAPL